VVGFTPRYFTPDTHWIGGWVGLRPGLNAMENRKMPYPAGNQTPILRLSSPQANRYTERLPHQNKFTFTEQRVLSGKCKGVSTHHYCHWTQTACNLTAGFSKINFNNILPSKLWKYNVKPLQMAAFSTYFLIMNILPLSHPLSLSNSFQFEFSRINNTKTVA
jgi:hypothetical protein